MGSHRYTMLVSTIVLAQLIVSKLLCQSPELPHEQEMMRFDYDRIEVTSNFLKAAYPELAGGEGMLVIDAVFPHSGEINFTFRRCRSGSGVPGPGEPSPPVPGCWPPPPPREEAFLAAQISLGEERQQPVHSFYANGSFVVDARLKAIRNQFKGRVYSDKPTDKPHSWTESDALRVLQSENPKFGPDHRHEFLAAIPNDAIQRVTGCKLLSETAHFDVFIWRTQPPRLEWVVNGVVTASKASQQANCSASFEPFQAHLTSFVINPVPIRDSSDPPN
jgi:hypothetical protein